MQLIHVTHVRNIFYSLEKIMICNSVFYVSLTFQSACHIFMKQIVKAQDPNKLFFPKLLI